MEKKGKPESRKMEILQDPLEVLGNDIMMIILGKLEPNSLGFSLLVSHGWNLVASSDSLWAPKCEELWYGKAHIARSSQIQGLSKVAAYSISMMEGRRTRIKKNDLCDHVWTFHFKKAAPEYWKNLDPYWEGSGGSAMRRYFDKDGSQTADPGDLVWGGHECNYSILTSINEDGKIRENCVRINRWPQMFVLRNVDWSWTMSNLFFSYSSIPDAIF